MIGRILVAILFVCAIQVAQASDSMQVQEQQESHQTLDHESEGQDEHGAEGEGGHHSKKPAGWSVIPFVLLLLMIATGPLFYPHFWHKSYPVISVILAFLVCTYYLFYLGNFHSPVHSTAEYIQFIALLTGLFVASGGILIVVDKKAKPRTNVIILAIGAVIANIIGTTGASMLLIRPFIRLNSNRIKPYHIVFFIFIVSNVGGSLTPIGDPPLFLGFLKGIPFEWTLIHNFVPWVIACIILLIFFYFFDIRNKADYAKMRGEEDEIKTPTGQVSLKGRRNFLWLAVVVGAVFLDPNVFEWVPGIEYEGQKFSYIREIIMLLAALGSYQFSDLQAIQGNEFSFEPIREVAFLFIGIFFTMMPALELVSEFAQSPQGEKLISPSTLYWGTGVLSGFLDNAPTYVNFLTASMASVGADVNKIQEVIAFANNEYRESLLSLMAISLGAVFFGAFTYIGNGPNFMVKSIAEQVGIKMPSFFSYIIKYSIPILLPMLIIIWLIFFMGH
ncbi:sodium:proton antiporter [Ekhidna sp.]|jgi:Na+/H+ antiporter NhaD/arsenite permease-like protein|uniref:sodium:proton antiporter n=1 Tax=Ekhidna sp. TaxID=2608089 RepID=UPI0032EB1A8F